MQTSRSATRKLVDQALERRDTDLPTFIQAGRRQGKTVEEMWIDLRNIAGIPISVRTLYRWAEELEEVAS